jgi:hypothetical protein
LLRVGPPVVIMTFEPGGAVTAHGPFPLRNAIWHVARFMRVDQGKRVWLEADGVPARRPGVRVSRGRKRKAFIGHV